MIGHDQILLWRMWTSYCKKKLILRIKVIFCEQMYQPVMMVLQNGHHNIDINKKWLTSSLFVSLRTQWCWTYKLQQWPQRPHRIANQEGQLGFCCSSQVRCQHLYKAQTSPPASSNQHGSFDSSMRRWYSNSYWKKVRYIQNLQSVLSNFSLIHFPVFLLQICSKCDFFFVLFIHYAASMEKTFNLPFILCNSLLFSFISFSVMKLCLVENRPDTEFFSFS